MQQQVHKASHPLDRLLNTTCIFSLSLFLLISHVLGNNLVAAAALNWSNYPSQDDDDGHFSRTQTHTHARSVFAWLRSFYRLPIINIPVNCCRQHLPAIIPHTRRSCYFSEEDAPQENVLTLAPTYVSTCHPLPTHASRLVALIHTRNQIAFNLQYVYFWRTPSIMSLTTLGSRNALNDNCTATAMHYTRHSWSLVVLTSTSVSQ